MGKGTLPHNRMAKFSIRVLDEKTDKITWTHISYIDEGLHTKFIENLELRTLDINEIVSRWAYEDFGYETTMSCKRDITILRELAKDRYKRAYPELYIESKTDRQGWFRVWLTKKVKEELGIAEGQCF